MTAKAPPTDQAAPAPNALDVHVGNRLRTRRAFLRISQEKLGDHIGVTFQQIQKFEKGANRISAGQLFLIANLLKVDVNYFFEGLNSGFGEPVAESISGDRAAAEGVLLNRAFARVSSPKLRQTIIDMVTAIADGAPPAPGR